ncbi:MULTISPECIES: J domain-containing protein [unclassified Sphingomonas]|uniref:J domain-containing protein n=1 Tax=unclassified Sphingomonas TaxID=196159 RepID=UPI002151F08B|nr:MULTISPECIES: J domain-containing protein [unclassified Sphingomonas]MCR5869910.1 J domain-containing protein [Sphingomonas sp. J344]UUX98392.1 J domain-containing protein [Sphingomonas sp. J315]
MKQWWQVLGVPRGSDRATIRRAYAAKLKTTNPEDDAKGFMALREAYEQALRWVEYQYFDDWDDAEEEAEVEPSADDPVPVLVAVDEPEAFEPALPLPPDAPPASSVPPDPFEATRAAEAAELERLLGELDAGLRGPWFKDREALRATFDAVMGTPALMEIDRRARTEYRLAALIADTIPRSDAILQPAMAAFGWEAEGNHPPAVWSLRARLDEWRLIASFGRGDHGLGAGWRALIDGKAPGWRRRIVALRPGIAGQIRQLFDLADYEVPGIAHSFHPKAADWWRAHLDAPRFGFAELSLLLIGTLAAGLFALVGATPALRLWGAAAAGSVGVVLAILHWRFVTPLRWRRGQGLAATPAGFGWRFGLWLVVTLTAIGLPLSPWVAAGIAASAFTLALTIFVLDGSEGGGGVPWRRVIMLGVVGAFVGPAFAAMRVEEQALVLVFAASSGLVGLSARTAIAQLIAPRPILIALGLLLALIVAAVMRSDWMPGTPLIPWGAAACTGLVLMSGLRAGDPNGRGDGVASLANMLLWAMLVVAAILSVPDKPGGNGLPPPISVVPADPMMALEAAEPGFRAVKTGNPELYAAVAAVRKGMADGSRDFYKGSQEIDRLVNAAYRKRLALAPASLIAAEMDIRLARLREDRSASPRACAGEPGVAEPVLSKPLRERHYAHALRVAASKPADIRGLTTGREIKAIELLRIAANGDAAAADRFARALDGSDPVAKCEARIAMMEALVAQDDADIAKTMRPTLIARAAPKSEKK